METVSYLQIDSRYRNKSKSISFHSVTVLESDPLSFTEDSDTLVINHGNHNLTVFDQIVIYNILPINKFSNRISVKKKSRYVRIYHHDHGIRSIDNSQSENYLEDLPSSFRSDDIIPDSNQLLIHNTNISLQIVGVTESLGSITHNMLNGTHKVSIVSVNGLIDPDSYYISLPSIADKNAVLSERVYVRLDSIHGIDLNLFTQESIWSIDSITEENITIRLPSAATRSINGGGDTVYLAHVSHYDPPYENPNEYVYYLQRAYNNVTKVRIISSIFPNTQHVVNSRSNRLYFRNRYLERVIEVKSGNYDLLSIAREIQRAFSQQKIEIRIEVDQPSDRITLSHYLPLIDPVISYPVDRIESDIEYVYHEGYLYHNQRLCFERSVLVDFLHETEAGVESITISINSITEIGYSFDLDTLSLILPHHDLYIDDYVISDRITDVLTVYRVVSVLDDRVYLEISETEFLFDNILVRGNRYQSYQEAMTIESHSHTIVTSNTVIDQDYLMIDDLRHQIVRRLGNRYVIEGSVNGRVMYPELFQLQDCENSLNRVLGLIDNGYSYDISNDLPTSLKGDPYLYVCCPQLVAIDSTGSVSDVFTIIKRKEDPGKILVDTYVPVTAFFPKKVMIDRLEISIRNPDAGLVEMRDDHSFSLEIVESYSD